MYVSADRIGAICEALADVGYTVALAGIFGKEPFDEAISGPSDDDWTRQDVFGVDGVVLHGFKNRITIR